MDDDGLVGVGRRRLCGGGGRGGEVLPGEAGPPRRSSNGRPRAGAADAAGRVAHAAEDGVELLDLGVGGLVNASGGGGGFVAGDVGGGALALSGGRRLHGRARSGGRSGVRWLRSVSEEKKKRQFIKQGKGEAVGNKKGCCYYASIAYVLLEASVIRRSCRLR